MEWMQIQEWNGKEFPYRKCTKMLCPQSRKSFVSSAISIQWTPSYPIYVFDKLVMNIIATGD